MYFNGNKEPILKYLSKQGFSLETTMAMNRNHNLLEFLLNDGGGCVNNRDRGGDSPLMASIFHNDYDLIRICLKHKSKISNQDLNSALTYALSRKTENAIKAFVDSGIDISIFSKNGENALGVAISECNTPVVSYLQSLGLTNCNTEFPTKQFLISKIRSRIGSVNIIKNLENSVDLAISEVDQSINVKRIMTIGSFLIPTTCIDRDFENFRFAEFFIDVPSSCDINNSSYEWVNQWFDRLVLMRINNQLFKFGSIISNEDPPVSICTGTDLCAFITIPDSNFEFPFENRPRSIIYMRLFPIYREERDFALEKGVDKLLKAFQKSETSMVFDPLRPCAVKAPKKKNHK